MAAVLAEVTCTPIQPALARMDVSHVRWVRRDLAIAMLLEAKSG